MPDSPPAAEDLPFIRIEHAPVLVGRGRDVVARLFHPTVSGRHALLFRNGEALSLEDLDSKFGTFVNGARVKKVALRVGDRVQFGGAVAYLVEANGLRFDATPNGMSLCAERLSISRNGTLIVSNVSFEIGQNSFIGILAPSGVGKSTLLNCLASFVRPGQGRVLFDEHYDQLDRLAEYREQLGHVPQDDLIFPTLSTRENLLFAARLRLNVEGDSQNLMAETDRVLEQVGLTAHADKRAGNLSGGQRKRLSVGVELLKRPRFLLLDEPTSGLDPATESSLMEQLRLVARHGTTVVCTTHLMENIRLFDAVIVLGIKDLAGRLAYAGPPQNLLARFGCTTFADLYDKLAQGRFTPLESRDETSSRPLAASATAADRAPPAGAQFLKAKSNSSLIDSSPYTKIKQLVNASGMRNPVRQILILLERAATLISRDRALVLAIVGQPVGLGLLDCLSQYAALEIVPLLFFSVVIAIWLGLNNSARDLVRDRKLYVRERLSGLRPGAYLVSRLLIHSLVGTGQLVLLLITLRFFMPASLARESVSLPWWFAILWLCYTTALGAGLLVSALMATEEAAVALLPLLIMPQLLISAVGTARVDSVFNRPAGQDAARAAFEPLTMFWRSREERDVGAKWADNVSLLCVSRPAILLLNPPKSLNGARIPLLADACHLLVLLLGMWTLTWVTFRWAENRWTQLIGVG